MRDCHSNSKYIYTIDEFISMVHDNPEYKCTPVDFIKNKLEHWDESYCDECGSKEGTFHARDSGCKYAVLAREAEKDGYSRELGEFTKYYHDPFYGSPCWAEYHLREFRVNPEYSCVVCGKGTFEKADLCDEHRKKLHTKLRGSRKLFELARKEEQMLELEFYKYETVKLSRSINQQEETTQDNKRMDA